jgi:hypothetical protein
MGVFANEVWCQRKYHHNANTKTQYYLVQNRQFNPNKLRIWPLISITKDTFESPKNLIWLR